MDYEKLKVMRDRLVNAIDADEWKYSWHLPTTGGRITWNGAALVRCREVLNDKLAAAELRMRRCRELLEEEELWRVFMDCPFCGHLIVGDARHDTATCRECYESVHLKDH